MEDIRIGYREILLYIAIANAVLGVLFGFFPLIAGLILEKRKYGILAFIGSILGGALAGVFLSFPVAAVFTWLIVKRSAADKTQAVETVANPIDLPAETSESQ